MDTKQKILELYINNNDKILLGNDIYNIPFNNDSKILYEELKNIKNFINENKLKNNNFFLNFSFDKNNIETNFMVKDYITQIFNLEFYNEFIEIVIKFDKLNSLLENKYNEGIMILNLEKIDF